MGVAGPQYETNEFSRSSLERDTIEGESPVSKKFKGSSGIPSTMGHEKPHRNLGGPSSKAKYSRETDSEEYREGKVKRTQE